MQIYLIFFLEGHYFLDIQYISLLFRGSVPITKYMKKLACHNQKCKFKYYYY